jgi:hypothetical protein
MELDASLNPNPESKANRYTLTDSEGITRIVYFPVRPIALDAQSNNPQLDYRGPEGEWTFTQKDIEKQQSCLGQLITIALPPSREGKLDLTIILPPINLAGQSEREFITIAIKTKCLDASFNPAGAAMTYEGFSLRAVAEVMTLPS